MKKNRIVTDLFGISLLLCVLVLVSFYMTTGLFARYTTKSDSGDTARVAEFDASFENPLEQVVDIDMYPLMAQQTWTVNATNNSEVSMKFFLKFETEGNLPILIEGTSPLQQDSTDSNLWYYVSSPSEGSFQLNALIGWDTNKSGYEYSGGVEQVKLTVYAEQVD